MTLCIRKLETIQGIYYGLTFYNGYFRAGVTTEIPPDHEEVTISTWDNNFNFEIKRMLVLQGKDPSDSTVWYWFPEDVVKQMAIQCASYEHISMTAATFLKPLLGVNQKSPKVPELLMGVVENKENFKDHPMEQHMCLALAMAAHPRLGAQSPLHSLAYAGIKVMHGYKFDPEHNWAKRPCPWTQGQAKADAMQKLGLNF